ALRWPSPRAGRARTRRGRGSAGGCPGRRPGSRIGSPVQVTGGPGRAMHPIGPERLGTRRFTRARTLVESHARRSLGQGPSGGSFVSSGTILRGSDVTEETAAMPTSTKLSVRDVVTVRLPAASAYLSVLRTATAGLAARLDFTLDEIEDLRIAVDEACAMLLAQAVPGTDLVCEFELTGDAMRISVSVLTVD